MYVSSNTKTVHLYRVRNLQAISPEKLNILRSSWEKWTCLGSVIDGYSFWYSKFYVVCRLLLCQLAFAWGFQMRRNQKLLGKQRAVSLSIYQQSLTLKVDFHIGTIYSWTKIHFSGSIQTQLSELTQTSFNTMATKPLNPPGGSGYTFELYPPRPAAVTPILHAHWLRKGPQLAYQNNSTMCC